MKRFLGSMLAGLVLTSFLMPVQAEEVCFTEPLLAIEDGGPDSVLGETSICIDGTKLKVSVLAENLEPQDVYNAWWVYFDDVSKCLTPNACGPADLLEPYGGNREFFADGSYSGGDIPQGVIGRMSSRLVSNSGKLSLPGSVRGFEFGSESELWILLISHGPARTDDAAELARQLLTPEMPDLGAPFAGRIEDGWISSWTAVTTLPYERLKGVTP